MTDYRKCNICGYVWKPRSSTQPQCSKCKSIDCREATEEEYEEYRNKNTPPTTEDKPDNVLTPSDVSESESESDHADIEVEDIDINALIAGKENQDADKKGQPHVTISPKLLFAVGIGLTLAVAAGAFFFRARRRNRRTETRPVRKDHQPEEQAVSKKRIHVAGFS